MANFVAAHALADRRDDLYETPACATEALLKHEKLPRKIWEPACGRGAIVEVLRKAGHDVIATDLVDYGYGSSRIDFLLEPKNASAVEAVVTNPPYKLAAQFVRKALELCPKAIMLLRLSFLEGKSRRNDILDGGTLARVHLFRNRLPMMHRDGWTGPKAESMIAYAWFVWERDNKLPTIINRITWEG